jgi:hypothetical protein
MKKLRYTLFFMVSLCLFSACGMYEQDDFDTPFVRIAYQESDNISITYNTKKAYAYYVYLSSKPLSKALEVEYEVEIGDGLTEGVDYQMITKGGTLTFLTGIYSMPIWIQWLPNTLDPTKDNSIRITLKSNNMGFNIGLPGPDHNQSTLTITKK